MWAAEGCENLIKSIFWVCDVWRAVKTLILAGRQILKLVSWIYTPLSHNYITYRNVVRTSFLKGQNYGLVEDLDVDI